jgi:hypothetical protein
MQVICIKILVPNFFTFANRVTTPTDRLLMPLNKAVHTVLLVLVFFPVGLFAEATATQTGNAAPEKASSTNSKSVILVKDVKFFQHRLGGQINPWNRMQVEVSANYNPDPKALNKTWVDKVKVTVTQVFKNKSAKAEDWNYYRSSVTILSLEINQPRTVSFYLPGDVVKRDNLRKDPDYFFVQVEAAGNEEPLFDAKGSVTAEQSRAVSHDLAKKKNFDEAKDVADRCVGNTSGILRPQFLVNYPDVPVVVPPSAEFIREDLSTK